MQLIRHKNNNCQRIPELFVKGDRISVPQSGVHSLNTFLKFIVLRMLVTLILCISIHSPSLKAETANVPPEQPWSFNGPFGTWDRAALQRGFQVYKEVCSACHGLNHLSYRNLSALGFSENEIKAIAKQYNVAELNDEGEPAERPARPSDKFVPPFANEKAARAANNGAYPVDLSMVVSARLYGADYVYSLLTGYHDPPPDVEMQPDMHYNLYFPGHQIAMIPPLVENQVAYADGTPATLDQMSRDVATFLHWAAHPQMEARKGMGVMVLIYISIFTVLMYLTMKRIWRRVK